jgi:acyl dehydratase
MILRRSGIRARAVVTESRSLLCHPARLDARFTGPVYPGETLRTRVWADGDECAFDTWVVERDAPALLCGIVKFTGPLAGFTSESRRCR